jgi:peptide/nickel transport system permease protein
MIAPSTAAAPDTAYDGLIPLRKRKPAWLRLLQRRLAVLAIAIVLGIVILAILAPILPLRDPDAITSANRLLPPGSPDHLFGTDELGRDLVSRMIWGARVSLLAGFGAAFLSLVVGATIGLIAGFGRGWIDSLLMRITDVVLAFPAILLAIGVVASLGSGLTNAMIAVAIAGFPLYARVVRGSVLSVRDLDYVEAARSIGTRNLDIMLRHILPNILAPIIVAVSLDVGLKIVVTSSLSFLGLGAQPPTADWGNMIASGRNYIRNASHLVVLPGIAIFLIALCLNIIGDQLRDILDPRLKQN